MHRATIDTRPETNVDSLTDALRTLGIAVTDQRVMGWSVRERSQVWSWILNRPAVLFPDRLPATTELEEDFPP